MKLWNVAFPLLLPLGNQGWLASAALGTTATDSFSGLQKVVFRIPARPGVYWLEREPVVKDLSDSDLTMIRSTYANLGFEDDVNMISAGLFQHHLQHHHS